MFGVWFRRFGLVLEFVPAVIAVILARQHGLAPSGGEVSSVRAKCQQLGQTFDGYGLQERIPRKQIIRLAAVAEMRSNVAGCENKCQDVAHGVLLRQVGGAPEVHDGAKILREELAGFVLGAVERTNW